MISLQTIVDIGPVQTKEGTNDKAHRAIPFPPFSNSVFHIRII